MSRQLQIVADLIQQSMSNTAIAMNELNVDHAALDAVKAAGERFAEAMRDGVVTLTEARRVYQAMRIAQASVEKCIQLDEADLSLGKEISRGAETVALMKGAAVLARPEMQRARAL